MPSKFVCQHCKRLIAANPRLKGQQRYCGDKRCQRARKRIWQRNKIASDGQYRLRQKQCQRRWCQSRPLHQYQREYRERHRQYVEVNRQKQIERNNKRDRQVEMEKIVKMDTLAHSSEKTGIYLLHRLRRGASGKIVKMDALVVKLTPLHDVEL